MKLFAIIQFRDAMRRIDISITVIHRSLFYNNKLGSKNFYQTGSLLENNL
jgi:hypothetical protein